MMPLKRLFRVCFLTLTSQTMRSAGSAMAQRERKGGREEGRGWFFCIEGSRIRSAVEWKTFSCFLQRCFAPHPASPLSLLRSIERPSAAAAATITVIHATRLPAVKFYPPVREVRDGRLGSIGIVLLASLVDE